MSRESIKIPALWYLPLAGQGLSLLQIDAMKKGLFILLFILPVVCSAQLSGNSVQLKADGNFISVADASSASLNDTMTLEMMLYFRCNNILSTHLMTKGWCGSDWSYYWSVYGQKLRFSRWNAAQSGCVSGVQAIFETADSIPVNTWVHVAVVIRDLSVTMYINGVDAGTTLISGTNGDGFNASNQPIRIGNYVNLGGTNTGTPKSNIDEVRIWHTARTPAELQANMSSELSGNEAGLLAYYKLNESGSGAGISVLNSKAGSPLPNGTSNGSAANLQFTDNSTIIDGLPNCDPILWLKADAGVTVNGSNEVTQWADQSGNNHHAVADGTTLPTLQPNTINNKPVINFTDDRLATPLVNLTSTNKTEIFAVYKGIGASAFTPFEFSDDGNVVSTGFYLADQDNSCPGCQNDVTAGLKGNIGYNQNSLNQTQGCPKIINSTYDKSLSTEEVKIWLNGVLQPKTPGTTNSDNSNSFGTHKFYLGKRSANCTFCPGVMGQFYLAELIVFPRTLSTKEKNQMITYLDGKYFTGSSSAYTGLPSVSDFSNAVFDDLSWKHSYHTANPTKVIASVKDYCAELGSRSDTVYVEPSAIAMGSTFAMRRHYTIQTGLNPAGNKRVRLYYTLADFADLQAAVPTLTAHNQLCVTKYDGPNEDGVFATTGGTLTFIPSNQITTGTAFGQRYLEFTVNGFSEFWIHPQSNVPLPVQLTSFTAEPCDGVNACLHWSSRMEETMKDYELQRSEQGVNYETIFTQLANNQVTNEYVYTDRPMLSEAYYRLRMNDADGQFSYSPIKRIDFESARNIRLRPNPATDLMVLDGLTGVQQVALYDLQGQRIWTSQTNGESMIIRTSAWPAGMYYLRISGDGFTETKKLLIKK